MSCSDLILFVSLILVWHNEKWKMCLGLRDLTVSECGHGPPRAVCYSTRIPVLESRKSPRRTQMLYRPACGPMWLKNLSCFPGGGHSCNLKDASSKKAGEHSEITQSTVMQGTLEKKNQCKKHSTSSTWRRVISWKVINVRVGEHKSLFCVVLRLPLTRTPRKQRRTSRGRDGCFLTS